MKLHSELTKAAAENNPKLFEEIIEKPEFDVNCSPLLVEFIEMQRPEWYLMRLIEIGADVNLCDSTGMSPLYAVVCAIRPTYEIQNTMIELIKRGSDVNTQWSYDSNGSALHVAAYHNNITILSILLYYGANVYVRDRLNRTPLKLTVSQEEMVVHVDIAMVLIEFYDKDYFLVGPVNEFFNLAVEDLDMDCEGTALLAHSCNRKDFFELFWHALESMRILDKVITSSFLDFYVKHSTFPNEYWLQYLYLILNILCNSNEGDVEVYFEGDFLMHLFEEFSERSITSNDCLAITSTCLSLGAPIHVHSFQYAFLKLDNKDVTTLLIYGLDRFLSAESLSSSLAKYILSGDVADSNKLIDLSFSYKLATGTINFCSLTRFFHIPTQLLEQLRKCCTLIVDTLKKEEAIKALEKAHQFPTLLELSRDATRQHLKKQGIVRCPYHFLDIHRLLHLPIPVRDVISYNSGLY